MSKPHRWEGAGGRGDWAVLLVVVLTAGCGTTRTSDTPRTATEQLLIAYSIDNTVSNLDFRLLAGKRVYLDAQYLDGVTDKGYLISSLRQQALACGCLLQEERKDATYVIEARAGSVGTDSSSAIMGVPKTTIPSVLPGIPGVMIPEIALAKKSNRRAVTKVAVFAYNRVSGDPIWQSGTMESVCNERDTWLCGAGPFRRGNLHRGTKFFDERHFVVPLLDKPRRKPNYAVVSVAQPAVWKADLQADSGDASSQSKLAKQPDAPAGKTKVIQASATTAGKSE